MVVWAMGEWLGWSKDWGKTVVERSWLIVYRGPIYDAPLPNQLDVEDLL